jgi:hypothetical protein
MRADYSGTLQTANIEELHKECVESLKDLMAQANRTCSLLEAMTEFPITLEIWQQALDQRVRQNHAQARS